MDAISRIPDQMIRQGIVAIHDATDTLIGTGILVSETCVLTCAHISDHVQSSRSPRWPMRCIFFGRNEDPRDVVELARPERTAGYHSDVALLYLAEPFNAAEQILSWYSSPIRPGDQVQFAGFRQGMRSRANPEIVRTNVGHYESTRGCYMLQDGCTVGFSGGPVLRSRPDGVAVVGMVIANLRDEPHRTWFLPYSAVERAIKALGRDEPPFPPREGVGRGQDLLSVYGEYLETLRQRHDLDKAFIDLAAEQLLPAHLKVGSVVTAIVAEIADGDSSQLKAFVLGNYGSGKSCVAVESAARALKHYQQRSAQRKERLPIYVQLRDWKQLPSWSDLARHLYESGHYPFSSLGEVLNLAETGELFFLLDGFDEIAASLSGSGSIALVNEIPRSLPEGASFIVFSRLSFFVEHQRMDGLLDETQHALPPELSSNLAAFKYLTLNMMAPSEAQILEYLREICGRDAEFAVKVVREIHDLVDLAKRPVLLRMIVGSIPELHERRNRSDQFRSGDLYEIYTTRWLEHEMDRSQLPFSTRRDILQDLALAMWRAQSLRMSRRELETFLRSRLNRADVGPLMHDIGNCTFLDLVSESYEFSHKSFLEYFVAGAIVRDLFHVRQERDPDPLLLSSGLTGAAPQNEVVDFVQHQVLRRVETDPSSIHMLIDSLSSSPWPQDRGRVGHLLGYLAVELEEHHVHISEHLVRAFHRETNPWAKRSLAIACGRSGDSEIMEQYVNELLPQAVPRFENLRYHIEHYGTINRVVLALIAHILSSRYRFLLGIDLFTLRQIINCEKPMTSEDCEFATTMLTDLRETAEGDGLEEAVRRVGPDLMNRIQTRDRYAKGFKLNSRSSLDYRDLADLYERVYSLKNLKRKGWVANKVPDPESVADHSYGVAILTLICARQLGLDVGRAVTMALLHDLSESVVGDIIPADGVDPMEKRRREEQATEQILDRVDPDGELVEFWRDFQDGRTPEGILVKELDRLEMAFQAERYEHTTQRRLDEFFPYVEKRLQTVDLVRVFQALTRARARGVASTAEK